MITNVLEYLENSAANYPDKTAFADLDCSCTFEQLLLYRTKGRNSSCSTFCTAEVRCRSLWKKG